MIFSPLYRTTIEDARDIIKWWDNRTPGYMLRIAREYVDRYNHWLKDQGVRTMLFPTKVALRSQRIDDFAKMLQELVSDEECLSVALRANPALREQLDTILDKEYHNGR